MTASEMKITELIKGKGEFTYSFEVTPDVKEEELRDLVADPLFFSVTWHAKSHQCESLNIDSIRMTCLLRRMHKHVLLHLSCDMLRKEYLNALLIMLQEKGVCNLLLVLGEGYDPNATDFKNTIQLIKYIRETTGQYFCIGVVGFPDCSDEKLVQTKEKVDSGADFLITQAFFDNEVYAQFKEKCEKIGIEVPIIPGVFAFKTYKQLTGFVNLCKIKVSDDLLQHVENQDKSKLTCIEITKQVIHNIRSKLGVHHFHFFTLNKLTHLCDLLNQFK